MTSRLTKSSITKGKKISVQIEVQKNGEFIGDIEVKEDQEEVFVVAKALTDEEISKEMTGEEIGVMTYVHNKLLNFLVVEEGT